MSHEVDEARAILRWATGRSSIRRVAEDLGIDHSVVARFLSGKAQKPRADVLARLLPYVARRRAEYEAHQSATATTTASTTQRTVTVPIGDGAPAVSIPLHVLTYWRGRVEEQVNNITGVARSLSALQGMLEQATAGMTEFVDSGVLPPPDTVSLSSPAEQSAKYDERLRAIAANRAAAASAAAETHKPGASKRRAAGG